MGNDLPVLNRRDFVRVEWRFFFEFLAELFDKAVDQMLFCVRRAHQVPQQMIAGWRVEAVAANGTFFLRPDKCAAHHMNGERCRMMAHPPFSLCRIHTSEWLSFSSSSSESYSHIFEDV